LFDRVPVITSFLTDAHTITTARQSASDRAIIEIVIVAIIAFLVSDHARL
jgi:hypothetical protein